MIRKIMPELIACFLGWTFVDERWVGAGEICDFHVQVPKNLQRGDSTDLRVANLIMMQMQERKNLEDT